MEVLFVIETAKNGAHKKVILTDGEQNYYAEHIDTEGGQNMIYGCVNLTTEGDPDHFILDMNYKEL